MAIIPMKRATFVTLSHKGDELLRLLQKLGVLHPEHIRGEEELGPLDEIRHRLNLQAAIIKDLDMVDVEVPEGVDEGEGMSFGNVGALLEKMRDLDDRIKYRGRALDQLKPWGDFNPESITSLEGDGVFVKLWSSTARLDEISVPEGTILRVINKVGDRVFFVTISRSDSLKITRSDEIALPDERLSDIEADLERLGQGRASVLRNIGKAKAGIDLLREKQEAQEREYYYQVTIRRAFDDGNMRAFAGWVPKERVEEVRKSVTGFEVPVVMQERDALPEEIPPVLTRNVFMAKVLEPLLRLLGVPDYRGLDPALFFAPFMLLFFGICLGDVGYGISLIIGGLLLKRILRKVRAARVAGSITVFFGVASIIVGLLTGSVFGIAPWGREWIPIDISFEFGDPMILFKISIALGIIHLTIAFFLAALSDPHWQLRLTKLGSIAVLWGGAMLVLGISFWWVALAAGLLLILLFFSDSKNIFKRLGIGLWGIYNQVSLVGDVMSYSRLFGLGIASAAIAGVVNQLATQVREAIGSPALGFIMMMVVLVIGHLFNLIIGVIGAVVHPARLHAVEALPKFVKFTGVEYKPLVSD